MGALDAPAPEIGPAPACAPLAINRFHKLLVRCEKPYRSLVTLNMLVAANHLLSKSARIDQLYLRVSSQSRFAPVNSISLAKRADSAGSLAAKSALPSRIKSSP